MIINSDALQKILDKGESVEWAGRPEPFQAVDSHNKKAVILRCVISIAIAAAILILYIVLANQKGMSLNIVVVLIILAAAAFFCVRPLLDARTLKKKYIYIITDRAAITFDGENMVKRLPLGEIDAVQFVDKGNGTGDVILGSSAIKRPYSGIYVTSLIPRETQDGNDSTVTGMAFYNVAEYANVRSLLPKTVPVTDRKLSDLLS